MSKISEWYYENFQWFDWIIILITFFIFGFIIAILFKWITSVGLKNILNPIWNGINDIS